MHFGRVEKARDLDLSLPLDPVRTERFLQLPRNGATEFYVGCPIWAAKTWVGTLYPKGTKPARFLESYATQFSSVELNSTFYHLLPPSRIEAWRKQTPPGFRFCPKVYRGISEQLGSSAVAGLTQQFCEAVSVFEDRLGLCFAQFPDTFRIDQLPALAHFLQVWPENLRLAVEFRNPTWFQPFDSATGRAGGLVDSVVNLLYRFQVATVITDTPGRRDVLHLSLTQPRVLIRFQGIEGDPGDVTRLTAWGERLRSWARHSMESIYFFTHQPSEPLIPSTARLAQAAIEGRERVVFPDDLFSKTS
jgi:uncharacterized protein YecE (DUF72 family)